jgi:hypothetical protein
MRIILTYFFIALVFSLSAQEKFIKKSRKLYEKGKYEKCIEKTKKYLKKNRKNPDLQYYIVQSNMALYEEKQDPKKFYQLKKILQSWGKLESYNKGQDADYSGLASSIQTLIYLELNDPKLNSRNKEFLHLQLAEVFFDTTDYYLNKHQLPQYKYIAKESARIDMDSLYFLEAKRRQLIKSAFKQIGVTYKYGGTDSTGFDCSGFTQYVYKSIGIELPHNAQLQSELGELIPLEEAQTGDLIFFGERRAAHAGIIYINGNGEAELIHCVSRGVSHDTNEDSNHIHWMNRPYKVKRFIYSDSKQ